MISRVENECQKSIGEGMTLDDDIDKATRLLAEKLLVPKQLEEKKNLDKKKAKEEYELNLKTIDETHEVKMEEANDAIEDAKEEVSDLQLAKEENTREQMELENELRVLSRKNTRTAERIIKLKNRKSASKSTSITNDPSLMILSSVHIPTSSFGVILAGLRSGAGIFTLSDLVCAVGSNKAANVITIATLFLKGKIIMNPEFQAHGLKLVDAGDETWKELVGSTVEFKASRGTLNVGQLLVGLCICLRLHWDVIVNARGDIIGSVDTPPAHFGQSELAKVERAVHYNNLLVINQSSDKYKFTVGRIKETDAKVEAAPKVPPSPSPRRVYGPDMYDAYHVDESHRMFRSPTYNSEAAPNNLPSSAKPKGRLVLVDRPRVPTSRCHQEPTTFNSPPSGGTKRGLFDERDDYNNSYTYGSSSKRARRA